MSYFITGGTGFIGKHLIRELLDKKKRGTIYVLVRRGSKGKFNALKKSLGESGKRLQAVSGDLAKSNLGVTAAKRRELLDRM